MRTFILLLLLAAQPLFAQTQWDRIEKPDHSFIEGKVVKVTDNHVEYRLAQNPDGPVYTIAKQDIKSIIYANGYEEIITAPADVTQSQEISQPVANQPAQSLSQAAVTQPASLKDMKYQGITERNPFLAGALSFLVPGAGQVYNKQYGKGAAIFGANVLSWVLAYNSAVNEVYDAYDIMYGGGYEEYNPTGTYIFLATAVASNLYGIIDAAVSANKINERYGLAAHLKVQPLTNFAHNQNGRLQPTLGAKLTYSIY